MHLQQADDVLKREARVSLTTRCRSNASTAGVKAPASIAEKSRMLLTCDSSARAEGAVCTSGSCAGPSAAPIIAIEMGRRAIPAHVRPSFDEMEKRCKNQAATETAAAA